MRGCHQLRKSWWSHHCEDVISLVKSCGVNHSGGISAGEASQWAHTITRSKAISACEDVISWKTWWSLLCEGISSVEHTITPNEAFFMTSVREGKMGAHCV